MNCEFSIMNSLATLINSSPYLPACLDVPWMYFECTLNLPSFFLPSFFLLPTHHFVFTKRTIRVIIVLCWLLAFYQILLMLLIKIVIRSKANDISIITSERMVSVTVPPPFVLAFIFCEGL